MVCKKCGKDLPEGALFCNYCGTKQKERRIEKSMCSKCGATIIPGASFCGECGQSIGNDQRHTCPKCGKELIGNMPVCAYCGFSVGGNSDKEKSQSIDLYAETQKEDLKESKYKDLINELEKATSKEELMTLSEKFASLDGYKESDSYLALCNKKIDELNNEERLEKEYIDAINDLNVAESERDYDVLANRFEALGNYKDSKEHEIECRDIVETKRLFEEKYNYALKKMNIAESIHEMNKAAELFSDLEGYKNSEELRIECLNRCKQLEEGKKEREYLEAVKSMEEACTEADYENVADMFLKMDGYKDSNRFHSECIQIIKEKKYKELSIMMETAKNETDYRTIEEGFEELKSFEDSEKKAEECRKKLGLIQKKKKKIVAIVSLAVIVAFIAIIVVVPKNGTDENSNMAVNEDSYLITLGELEKKLDKEFKRINPSLIKSPRKDDLYSFDYSDNAEGKDKFVIVIFVSDENNPINNKDKINCLCAMIKGPDIGEYGKYYEVIADVLGEKYEPGNLAKTLNKRIQSLSEDGNDKWQYLPSSHINICFTIISDGALIVEETGFFPKKMDIEEGIKKYMYKL